MSSCSEQQKREKNRLDDIIPITAENISHLTAFQCVTAILPLETKTYVGTMGGVFEFDKQSNRLTRLLFSPSPQFPSITDIIADSRGCIWIATDAGLAKISGEKCVFHKDYRTPIQKLAIESERLWMLGKNNRVIFLSLASSKSQHPSWSGFEKYLFFTVDEGGQPPDKRRLIGYHSDDDQWHVISEELPRSSLHNITLWDGKIWGVLYDREGETISSYGLTVYDGSQWLTDSTLDLYIALESQNWTGLTSNGESLYAASERGVLCLQKKSAHYLPFPKDPGFIYQDVLSIASKYGQIWVGTERGLIYHDGHDWFFNDFIQTIVDNTIRNQNYHNPFLLIETMYGLSLYNTDTESWSWEVENNPFYGVITSSGTKNISLYKFSEISGKTYFSRIIHLNMVQSNQWDWAPIAVPPFHFQEIRMVIGDYLGNIWVQTIENLWRFNSGNWICYGFSLNESLSHKYINVEEISGKKGKSKSPSAIVVEKIVPTKMRTWFQIKGRGWKAVLEFKHERWDLNLLKERFSADLVLIGAQDRSILIQEDNDLCSYVNQERSVLWKGTFFSDLKINCIVGDSNSMMFSISGLKNAEIIHSLYVLDSKGVKQLEINEKASSPEFDTMTMVQDDLWIGSKTGIIILHNLFPQNQKQTNRHQKNVVVQGDISPKSIGKPEKVKGISGPAILPVISPDDRFLVFVRISDKKRTLWIHDLLHGKSRELLEPDIYERAYKPSFSPEGDTILFYAEHNRDEELFSYNVNSKKLTRLTRSKGKDWDPSFDSTGSEVFFTSNRWGSNDIYMLARSTKKTIRLTTEKSSEWHPTVSPDGEQVVYVRSEQGNPGDLWIMSSSGENKRPFVENQGKDWLPSWSPDGRYIAFTTFTGGFNHLNSIDVKTNRQLQLTSGPYNDLAPTWSADGRFLFFHSDRSGIREIWKLRVR